MLDLSKLNFNNYYIGNNNFSYMPNYSFVNFPPVFINFNPTNSFNIPFLPNFTNFYSNINFEKPTYPVFNFNYNQPSFDYKKSKFSYKLQNPLSVKKEEKQTKLLESKISYLGDKKIDNSYITLSQKQAEQKAKNDKNLELLEGGKNWSVAKESFVTDIPYAKKGTSVILEKVSNMVGEKLIITSALGTGQAGNPHQKTGYESHHNAENPKLDIRTRGNGNELAAKLKSTGYFSRVSIEKDHLDVQIDITKFKNFETIA